MSKKKQPEVTEGSGNVFTDLAIFAHPLEKVKIRGY